MTALRGQKDGYDRNLVLELFLPHSFGKGRWSIGAPATLSVTGKQGQDMPNECHRRLIVRLHGAPQVYMSGGPVSAVHGRLNVALIAVLATSPGMSRSRAGLVDLLWSDAAPHRGRANLRQLLHALRGALGDSFDICFAVSKDSVALRPEQIQVQGTRSDGVFLEGLDLDQDGFEEWLREKRLEHDAPQIAASPVKAAIQKTAEHEAEPGVLPRVMVLPFAEVSLGSATGLGEALAQEMTVHFAQSQLVDVISYFSIQNIVPEVSGDVACDFVLSGQCRLSGDVATIDVSLAEFADKRVVWADRHKITLSTFLAGEDETASNIAGLALRVVMSTAIGQTSSKPLPELEAHRLLISAVALMHSFELNQFLRAKELLEEVIYRCPGHSIPRAWLAQWHLLKIYQKWSDVPAKDQMAASDAIKASLDFNVECPLALAIDGNIQTILKGDFQTAQHRFDTAGQINPSSAFGTQLAAVLATFTDDGDKAVALTKRAHRLSPRDPRRPFFQTLSAGSYVAGGLYDEAVAMAQASLRHHPLHLSAHRCKVIALQLSGREAEARVAARDLMRLDPDLRVAKYQTNHPAAATKVIRTWATALKQAGVPVN